MKGVRRGFLKFYILKLLSGDNYTGYGLIQAIEKETGFWKPSTGSVYPLLESLEEEGLIECGDLEDGSGYMLTPEGKQVYEEAEEAREKMRQSIKQSMIVFSQIFNDENIREVAENIGEGLEHQSKLKKMIKGLHHRLTDMADASRFNDDQLMGFVEETHEKLDQLTEDEE